MEPKQTNEINEINLKGNLKNLTILFIFIGILLFILQGLIYLGDLISNPLWNLNSIIGNILMNTLGKIPILISSAIIVFIAGIIIWIGTLLKDEGDQLLYILLTFGFWIMDGLILFILGVTFINSLIFNNGNNSISTTSIIGLGFLLFIIPPFIFAIIKGIIYLKDSIKKNGQ
jgi:hypothetical protein